MEPNTQKKYSFRFVLTTIAAIFLFSGCSDSEIKIGEKKEIALLVKTQTVRLAPLSNEIAFSGNAEGTTTVKLGFMVPGKVNLLMNKVGQFVTKGQLIATLENTSYTINKQLADVQLHEISEEYARLEIMHNKGSLSHSEFSKIGSSLRKARLQQKLEIKHLKDTRLYSPIDGILLSKQVEVGEIIDASTPLFVIADIRKISILAFVPEGEINSLRIGQEVKVNIASIDKAFKGWIKELGGVADPASRAFTIKIAVNNSGLHIRPGMIAEARISIAKQKAGLTLPTECVINDLGNQSYVYVADKTLKKAFKRHVSLGKMVANNIEILSGLSVGESVIVSGQTKIYDGALIIIQK